jgi:hypothetical protein
MAARRAGVGLRRPSTPASDATASVTRSVLPFGMAAQALLLGGDAVPVAHAALDAATDPTRSAHKAASVAELRRLGYAVGCLSNALRRRCHEASTSLDQASRGAHP